MDSSEELKKILQLLDSDSRNKKKFFFLRNVDKEYCILPGMTLRDMVNYVLPSIGIIVIIFAIPPHTNFNFIIFKIVLSFLVLAISVTTAFVRPIIGRPNIRLKYYIKIRMEFYSKNKIYFRKHCSDRRIYINGNVHTRY